MGWLVHDKNQPLHRTRDEYLRNVFESVTEEYRVKGYSCKILASSFVGRTWYAAAHNVLPVCDKYPNGGDFVTAYVVLTCGSERGGFGYKDMSETMGPCEVDCPAYILAMLSPVSDLPYAGYAAEWRAACAEKRATKAAERKSIVKIAPGMTVKLARTLRFRSGFEADTFTIVPNPPRTRGVIATHAKTGSYYRLNAADLQTATIVESV